MTNDLDYAVEHLTEFADELSLRSDMIGNSIARVHGERLRLILAANRKMRAALEAFVRAADQCPENWPNETTPGVVNLGQCRAARSALSTKED